MKSSKNILMALICIVSLIAVIMGQKHIGYVGLSVQILGVIGLVSVLGIYNRKYK